MNYLIPNTANFHQELKGGPIKGGLNTKVVEGESKISDITNLAPKATEIENKTLNTINFTTFLEFNRLVKVSFDAKIKEVAKSLASKTQLNTALGVADTNREKIKNFRRLI